MENRVNIDIQERTFKFGVRIVKFVDKLPHTLSATDVTDLHTECDEVVRILFAILRKARSTRASSSHCSLSIDH